MELTILLSKVFGVYLLIAGIAVFFNRKHIMAGVLAIHHERFAQLMAGMLSLLGGLLMINVHNDWSSWPATVITVIGWMILLKGLFYIFLPETQLVKWVKLFSERSWYTMDGILALLAGAYLAMYGFGLW